MAYSDLVIHLSTAIRPQLSTGDHALQGPSKPARPCSLPCNCSLKQCLWMFAQTVSTERCSESLCWAVRSCSGSSVHCFCIAFIPSCLSAVWVERHELAVQQWLCFKKGLLLVWFHKFVGMCNTYIKGLLSGCCCFWAGRVPAFIMPTQNGNDLKQ